MTAVSYKVVHTEPVPPRKLNPSIPFKLEGIILRQVEAALKGDAKAALAALRMMAQVGLLDAKEITEDGPQLSATERAIVDEMFETHATRRRQK